MTTALYRRYRPETFQEVIGQEHVTEPLMAALRADRVTHAYLFSGPRGCGKTTSARILARCLNCAQGPTDTPCGTCDSCVELARSGSGSLDVVEIDAASHNGVDDARELRERASFAPARDRYKIFILDEAHMVTPQGFNALLKLVEEPPEHVKFIFATTEPDKVIGTIRSRTHHYPFRLVPPDVLLAYLEELVTAEGVQVGGGVLPMVVRAGGGSVRDTLSVLDQLIGGAQDGRLEYERAVALLGYTDAALLDDVVDAIAARDGASLFRVVDRVIGTGHDPRRFVEDLLQRLRDLVVIAMAGEHAAAALRGVPADQLERMRAQAQHLGAGQVTRAADLTNDALTEMSGATSPRLQLELLCARILLPGADAGDAGFAARLDRLERGAPAATPLPAPLTSTGPVATVPVPAPAQPGPTAEPGPAARPSTAGAAPQEPAPSGTRPADAERDVRADAPAAPAAPTPAPTAPAPTAPGAPRTRTEAENRSARPAGAGGRPPAEGRTEARARAEAPGTEVPGTEVPGAEVRGAGAAAAAAGTGSADPSRQAGASRPDEGRSARAVAPPAPVAPTAQENEAPDTEMVRHRWSEVVATLARLKRTTWALVSQNAQVGDISGGALRLVFDTAGLATAFRGGPHAEHVQQALAETLGLTLRVEPVVRDAPRGTRGSTPAPPTPSRPDAVDAARSSWAGPAQPAAAPGGPRAAAPADGTVAHGHGHGPAGGQAPDGGPATSGRALGTGTGGEPRSSAAPGTAAPGTAPPGATAPAVGGRPASGGPAGASTAAPAPSAADEDFPPEPPEDDYDAPPPEDPRRGPTGARPATATATRVPTARTAVVSPADDVASLDDPDAEGSGLVGAPLLAKLLGGRIIDEITLNPETGAP
ncbi:DNA polymerase III subunit gamma and tau [Georgenia muralis]